MADERKVRVTEGSLYSGLPSRIQFNLRQLRLKRLKGSAKDCVSTFLKNVVKHNRKDLDSRICHRPLMLDNLKQSRPESRRKKKEMSAREKRAMGVFKIAPQNQKYEMYLPLHKLWSDYMHQTLNIQANSNLAAMYPKLLRADYHGCIMTVSRSKCPSYVGVSGIVVQEMKNVFQVITKHDKLKVIPKANSLFVFELGGFFFTLHGNHFRYRSSERSARKFKSKASVDL